MTTVQFYDEEYVLENTHTRHLLRLLDDIRRAFIDIEQYGSIEWDELSTIKNLVKIELSKREHIPNKIEAREIRRENARIAQGKKRKK